MTEMTSRQRVLAALNHQEPDRVPLDIGGGTSTTMVVEAYEKLKAFLGMEAETKVMDMGFRLAEMDERVLRLLGSDCRPLRGGGPAPKIPPRSDRETFVDAWSVTWRRAFYGDGCYYWELEHSPLAAAGIEDLDRFPWPEPADPRYVQGLAERAQALREGTDYAIVADGGFKSFWELGYVLRGFQQLLVDLILDPKFVMALMARLLEMNIAGTRGFLDAVGPYIDVFRLGDDLAGQNALLFSPQTFRSLLKPTYKSYIAFVKSKTDAKIFYHSCGNVAPLLDDLIEIGVDVINPVQVSALGDTASLKSRFGDRVALWGGIDTQQVLPHGSVADVEAEVRRRIRDLAPGGGYVVASVHNIQPDVPPQNLLAMVQATRNYGAYPLVA